jgi:hypothetical protein
MNLNEDCFILLLVIGVPRMCTPRTPATLACSMGASPWLVLCKSGSPEPLPSVDSSFGCARCWTADRLKRRGRTPAPPWRAHSVTKSRSPFLIFCLAVCWQGQCGPPTSGGGTERIGCRRKKSGSLIGFSLGGEDQGTSGTSWRVLPWCVGAYGGIKMMSSSKAPPLHLS